ncbi:hypothetical protein O181_068091 [Austropuccinia psidii MF-1]|uniref:Uncharacterized protein n=1 Tax=Austropuccinia psidii MF-1 TaxID=1389203 RepID=A0A9Q3EU65_9BASI|nr:hypothetical protein [Austropuccinia psidii MF-1]
MPINLDAIFSSETPRLLNSAVKDGSECSSDNQEDFFSFQNNSYLSVEAPAVLTTSICKKTKILNLPKGWVMDLVPNKSPKDISATADTENIISVMRRTVNMVVPLEGAPSTYYQAMSHTNSYLWREAIINELASRGENSFWRLVS